MMELKEDERTDETKERRKIVIGREEWFAVTVGGGRTRMCGLQVLVFPRGLGQSVHLGDWSANSLDSAVFFSSPSQGPIARQPRTLRGSLNAALYKVQRVTLSLNSRHPTSIITFYRARNECGDTTDLGFKRKSDCS